MKTVRDVYNAIDKAAPFAAAEPWDNPGLLVGGCDIPVKGAIAALDVTDEVISEAVNEGANLIVTHHPVIFNALKNVRSDSLVYRLIREGISVISAHTNFDVAAGGVNDILASRLDLRGVTVLPDGFVRVGALERGMTPPEFAYYVKCRLELDAIRYCDGGSVIERVAVCGGSGGSGLEQAAQAGAQAYVTGDVKHDVMLAARRMGITLLDAGHYGTEVIAVNRLCEITLEALEQQATAHVSQRGFDPSTTI